MPLMTTSSTFYCSVMASVPGCYFLVCALHYGATFSTRTLGMVSSCLKLNLNFTEENNIKTELQDWNWNSAYLPCHFKLANFTWLLRIVFFVCFKVFNYVWKCKSKVSQKCLLPPPGCVTSLMDDPPKLFIRLWSN